MVNYRYLEESIRRLQEQVINYQTLNEDYPKNIHEAIADSVEWRFKFCYDALWKILRKHIIEELALPDVPNSPKPVFRIANENDLLDSAVEKWFKYVKARIDIYHDYIGENTTARMQIIPDFVADAIVLYCKMSGKKWE